MATTNVFTSPEQQSTGGKYSEEQYAEIGQTIHDIYRVLKLAYKNNPSEWMSHNGMETPSRYSTTDHPQKFILREYYGSPSYLQTPIGEVSLTGSTGSSSKIGREKFWKFLKQQLGLKLIEEGDYEGGSHLKTDAYGKTYRAPNRRDHLGYFGPWWLVTKTPKKTLLTTFHPDRKKNYTKNTLDYAETSRIFKTHVPKIKY